MSEVTVPGDNHESRLSTVEANLSNIARGVEEIKAYLYKGSDRHTEIISRLALDMHVDEIQMKRLKKRKLLLKDQIARVESLLIPDLNA